MDEAEDLAKATYDLEMARMLLKEMEQTYRKALKEYADKVKDDSNCKSPDK